MNRVLTVGLVLSSCLPTSAAETKLVDHAGLMKAAPLPAGFRLDTTPVIGNGKPVGHLLNLTKMGSMCWAEVAIDNRDLPARGHRIATLKGSVNGSAQPFLRRG